MHVTFVSILSSLFFVAPFPLISHRMKCQKEDMSKAQVLCGTSPVRWHSKLKWGSQKLYLPTTAEAAPQGLAEGRRQLMGSGESAESSSQQQGCMAQGPGHRLSWSQFHFEKVGDGRSLKCYL